MQKHFLQLCYICYLVVIFRLTLCASSLNRTTAKMVTHYTAIAVDGRFFLQVVDLQRRYSSLDVDGYCGC